MTALYATGRLLWRRAMLIALFPLGLVTWLALWDLPHAGLDDRAVRDTLWRFATIVPAMMGVLLSMFMRELQHTLFAWTLPDLPRKLRLGKAVAATVMAAGNAAASVPFLRPGSIVAVFGLSWLSFAAGGVVFDPVLSKVESRGVGLIIIALALGPLYVERVIELQPYLSGVLAAVTGALLMRREFGVVLTRKRPFTFTSALTSTAANSQYWARETKRDVEWSRSLAGGGLIDWLRAAHHEGYGGGKAGFFTMRLGQLAITVVTALVMALPNMVVYFPWLFMDGRRQLLTRLPYPVHRAQRAKLFFLSNLIDSLTAVALTLAGLGIMALAGYSFETERAGVKGLGLLTMLLSFVVFAPVIHWTNIRGPYDATIMGKEGVKRFAFVMLYVSLVMAPGFVLPYFVPWGLAAWLGLGTLGIITHIVYWLALRRHFAHADLVVARS